MKIGLVVPFYNGYQWLNKLIKSFDEAAEGYICTLIIIDNSPENKPIDTGNPANLTVEVIRENPGIGYGKACNRGYKKCLEQDADYMIVVNQDGYASKEFIKELIAPFQTESGIMLSAPLLKTYQGNETEDFFVKYYLSQVPSYITDLMNGTAKPFYELSRISGASFAFNLRNEKYVYPYLFDPLFHMYYEDEDLCQRIRQIGGKIVLVGEKAVFYHQHSHTTDLENQEGIQSDKLVSEKILRLKDLSKSSLKAFYGIFVSTASGFTYHLLRGEFKKCFFHLRSFLIIIYKLPAILKTRRMDLLNINA